MTAASTSMGCAQTRQPFAGPRPLWPAFAGISAGLHAAAILAMIGSSEPLSVGESGQLEAAAIQVSLATSIGMPEIAPVEETQTSSKEEKSSVEEKKRPPVAGEAAPDPQEAQPENRETAKAEAPSPAMARIEASQAASGASAGEIEKYGREVSLALARSVPKGKGRKGKVTLAFVRDPAGRIEHLELASPSGDPALDEAAQIAVRKTAFPPPPQGMTGKQRTYVIPFQFR